MGKLYTVPVGGGLARDAGPDMGVAGGFSPDGTRLAVNRKSQQYWRKFYRGAYQSDVTVMDLASKTFKDLTTFDGMDSWPMWSQDGFIYFVSDRDPGAQANLWRVPESGGEAERVTGFTGGDVRFPALSADGRTIVFERDFGIAKLDLASREVTPLSFDIAAETQESLTEFKDFHSTVDDYDLAPDGKRIAFAVHGEVFTAPTPADEGGELRQLTDGPARDQDVLYSPDGKTIAYVSDRDGREEIYARLRRRRRRGEAGDGHRHAQDRLHLVARLEEARLHRLRRPALHRLGGGQGSEGARLIEVRPDRPPGVVARRQVDRLREARRVADHRDLPDPGRRRRGEEGHVRLLQREEPAVLLRRQEALLRPRRGGLRRLRGGRATLVAALLHAPGEADEGPRRRGRRPIRRRRLSGRGDGRDEKVDGRAVVAAIGAEDRLGGPEAADPAGHADGVGPHLHPGPRRPHARLRRLRGRRRRRRRAGPRPGRHARDLHDPRRRQEDDPTHRGLAAPGRARRRRHPARPPRRLRRRHLQPATYPGWPHPVLPGGGRGLQHVDGRRGRRRAGPRRDARPRGAGRPGTARGPGRRRRRGTRVGRRRATGR